jgi:hypothetical protein
MAKREKADPGKLPRYIGNDFEQSAGRKSAPDSKRGILATWARERFKTFCTNHPDALQTVVDVSNDIRQLPTCAMYDALLSCGCRKTITVNLRRPKPVEYDVPVLVEGMEAS